MFLGTFPCFTFKHVAEIIRGKAHSFSTMLNGWDTFPFSLSELKYSAINSSNLRYYIFFISQLLFYFLFCVPCQHTYEHQLFEPMGIFCLQRVLMYIFQ